METILPPVPKAQKIYILYNKTIFYAEQLAGFISYSGVKTETHWGLSMVGGVF